MVPMGSALLRFSSPGALAMPAQAKPRARLRAGNVQLQGSGDYAGSFACAVSPRPPFTGNLILAGQWLEPAEQDIEPAEGSGVENLVGYDARQKRSVESAAKDFGAAGSDRGIGCLRGVLSMTPAVNEDPNLPCAANRNVCSTASRITSLRITSLRITSLGMHFEWIGRSGRVRPQTGSMPTIVFGEALRSPRVFRSAN
jgi:hypothetical protein